MKSTKLKIKLIHRFRNESDSYTSLSILKEAFSYGQENAQYYDKKP